MFSNEQIDEILKPLQDKEIYADSLEQQRQHKILSNFQYKLRSLEILYAEVYAQMIRLEGQLNKMRSCHDK